jgi:hypothetical protein
LEIKLKNSVSPLISFVHFSHLLLAWSDSLAFFSFSAVCCFHSRSLVQIERQSWQQQQQQSNNCDENSLGKLLKLVNGNLCNFSSCRRFFPISIESETKLEAE